MERLNRRRQPTQERMSMSTSSSASPVLDANEPLGYLETTGRVSGLPRETEIWWALDDTRIFILSGGGLEKDWCRNVMKTPEVRFRVRDTWVRGVASVVTDPDVDRRAREVVAAKYYHYDPARDADLPNAWAKTATPVVIDISAT
jgi:deazaflavin-dependent oxidoreductase (nitroreductase family)